MLLFCTPLYHFFVQCCAILYTAVLFWTLLCCFEHYCVDVLYIAVILFFTHCSDNLYTAVMLFCTLLWCSFVHSSDIVLYNAVLLFCTLLCCFVSCCAVVLYTAVLCCILLCVVHTVVLLLWAGFCCYLTGAWVSAEQQLGNTCSSRSGLGGHCQECAPVDASRNTQVW